MKKITALAFMVFAMSFLAFDVARAMPFTPAVGAQTGVAKIDWHCQDGEHWSDRYQRCLRDERRSEFQRDCGEEGHWSERYRRCVANEAPVVEAPGCREDEHWSRRYHRCLPNEEAPVVEAPQPGIVIEGGNCGLLWHWSDRKGKCVRNF